MAEGRIMEKGWQRLEEVQGIEDPWDRLRAITELWQELQELKMHVQEARIDAIAVVDAGGATSRQIGAVAKTGSANAARMGRQGRARLGI